MSFPRYPKYKASGVEWLGDVPEHWQLVNSRRLFNQAKESAQTDDVQLSATQKYGVVPQNLFMEIEGHKVALALSGLDNFKHVEADDFVISLRSFQGGIERSKYSGCVSPAYTVLRPAEPVDASYWAFLLKSRRYVDILQTMNDGLRDGKSISYQQFGQIRLPYLPLPEQTAIAEFLDRETAKIDDLVAEQRQLMELLKEKRQAVISHAVTKGLNPDAPMKPSGIEWLGDVPKHWCRTRIKRTARPGNKTFVDGDWIESPYITTEGVRLVQCGNVGTGVFEEQGFRYVSEETFASFDCTEVEPGNVLICRLQSSRTILAGRACLAPNLGVKMITSVDNCIVKPSTDFDPRYIVYQLSTAEYLSFVEVVARGGTRDRVSRSMLGNIDLVAPPFVEQKEIAEFLDTETAKLDALTAESQRAIDLLQERRTALISAAVTGQIDVRQQTQH